MKTKNTAAAPSKQTAPAFMACAERAFGKVARQVRAGAGRNGRKPLVWKS
ncbi:MAG: hypothetical protein LBC18_09520 [Opitutaceae bacterium]|jgi:hypothetical protein|nr:hypothetical protein [Opitutaceae bacterium]